MIASSSDESGRRGAAAMVGQVRTAWRHRPPPLHGLDVPVRIGVHTGEVELAEDDVKGIAVHIASRVAHIGGADGRSAVCEQNSGHSPAFCA